MDLRASRSARHRRVAERAVSCHRGRAARQQRVRRRRKRGRGGRLVQPRRQHLGSSPTARLPALSSAPSSPCHLRRRHQRRRRWFCHLDGRGSMPVAWVSTDGSSWTSAAFLTSPPGGSTTTVNGCLSTGNGFIAYGGSTGGGQVEQPALWTSSDGTAWQQLAATFTGLGGGGPSGPEVAPLDGIALGTTTWLGLSGDRLPSEVWPAPVGGAAGRSSRRRGCGPLTTQAIRGNSSTPFAGVHRDRLRPGRRRCLRGPGTRGGRHRRRATRGLVGTPTATTPVTGGTGTRRRDRGRAPPASRAYRRHERDRRPASGETGVSGETDVSGTAVTSPNLLGR